MSDEISPIERYIRQSEQAFVPMNVTLEVSLICNLKCTHCYNFDRSLPQQKVLKNYKTLSNEEILRVIKEISQLGSLFLIITGGEPFAHPDIFTFIAEARKNNLAIRLKTNATHLTEPVVKRLASYQVQDYDVSVYGHTAETHDAFTKKPGSFVKTMEGLKNLKKHGMFANISFIVNKLNYKHIEDMREISLVLGFRSVFSFELTSRNDGSSSSTDYRLDKEDMAYIFKHDKKGEYKGHFNESNSMSCACAKTNMAVASNGNVYPCIGAPIRSGNIREESLLSIWENSKEFKRIRGLGLKDYKVCSECNIRKFCQRSSGSAFLNTGDYTAADPWSCEQAELLKKHNEGVLI